MTPEETADKIIADCMGKGMQELRGSIARAIRKARIDALLDAQDAAIHAAQDVNNDDQERVKAIRSIFREIMTP